jgi:hypothetical protein
MGQERRGLTAGEIAWARQAFGDSLPYQRIRIAAGAQGNPFAAAAFRNGNSAITLRHTIHFAPVYYLPDFAAAKPAARGLLIHELTHVWQYRRLTVPLFLARYGIEFVGAGFNAPRMYEYRAGETRFARARLEAQASMVGDYGTAVAAGDEAQRRALAQNLAGSGFWGL